MIAEFLNRAPNQDCGLLQVEVVEAGPVQRFTKIHYCNNVTNMEGKCNKEATEGEGNLGQTAGIKFDKLLPLWDFAHAQRTCSNEQ